MTKTIRIKERTVSTKCYKAIRRPSGYARDNLPKRMKLRQLIDRARGMGWNLPLIYYPKQWDVFCVECSHTQLWVEELSLEQQFDDMKILPEMDEKLRVRCDHCCEYVLNFKVVW